MAIERQRPGPGQESVWDYPRPPALEFSSRRVEVVFAGMMIADSNRTLRVLETSHPPVYFIPLADVVPGVLVPSGRAAYSEFLGEAHYLDVVAGDRRIAGAAWAYEAPSPGYEPLTGYVAFSPRAMDECRVDGKTVRPQPGEHYGGWVTDDVVGPFRGEPAVNGW